MPRCTRTGCKKEYSDDSKDPCIFHSGAPVFHEGLKSWSCCSDVNKPVLDFDEFMAFPGCTQTDLHTSEAPRVESTKAAPSVVDAPLSKSEDGKEVYSSGASIANLPPQINQATSVPAPAPPLIEEEDDLDIPVPAGTACRRKGCGVTFESDEANRRGDGEGTVCTYHSHPPIFREGSKGYLCCKPKVLEFDEFLKIKGCKIGRHVFVAKASTATPVQEEVTICRIDHYQTIDQVHVSIFAKKADKELSNITLDTDRVSFSLVLPGSKRFIKTLDLFGPIDPAASTYTFFGTKVELHLRKQDGRSWTVLEKTSHDLGNINLTFGVGGRTGTIGAKDLVLDEGNKLKA